MLNLTIFDSLLKQKISFKPLYNNEVKLYVCGPTVYDYCHLGHARTYVCFDVVVRLLKTLGYSVKYVRNITDIDDKIINRAQILNESVESITKKYTQAMHEDFAKLNILPPDNEPKATEHLPQIIALINKLLQNGVAYKADNGDIYFEVNKFKEYGQLGRKDLSGQELGKRIEISPHKRHPEDFVLWKSAKKGEPQWQSPWGAGRPGWHIECSAMAMYHLGESLDIHGGGFDLQFPHHDNEIAQSSAATNKQFARFWMHVGFLQVDKEKMSKSLGNFITIRELLNELHPEVIRYFLLSSHYRSQQNYSEENIKISAISLSKLYQTLVDIPLEENETELSSEFESQFFEALSDDFNTPKALSVLFNLTHEVQKAKKENLQRASNLGKKLLHLGNILGILYSNPIEFLQFGYDNEDLQMIHFLIQKRENARFAKNWTEADEIRNQLELMGVQLEDSQQGTRWYRK